MYCFLSVVCFYQLAFWESGSWRNTYWYWKNQRYLKAKGSKRTSDTKRHYKRVQGMSLIVLAVHVTNYMFHAFIPSFLPSFLPSFFPSFVPLFVHSFIDSLIHYLIRSVIPSIDHLVDSSFDRSLDRLIDRLFVVTSCVYSFILTAPFKPRIWRALSRNTANFRLPNHPLVISLGTLANASSSSSGSCDCVAIASCLSPRIQIQPCLQQQISKLMHLWHALSMTQPAML